MVVALCGACTLAYDAGDFTPREAGVPTDAASPTPDTARPSEPPPIPDAARDTSAPAAVDRAAYPVGTRWWDGGRGANQHGYLVVVAPGRIDWTLARDAAKSIARGHLVTFASLDELTFVQDLVADTPEAFAVTALRRDGPWVGLQRTGSTLTSFSWATGEPYAHDPPMWSPGEPTDEAPGEPFVHFLGFTTSRTVLLNDTTVDALVMAYVAEIE